jgi:hypothetical protein
MTSRPLALQVKAARFRTPRRSRRASAGTTLPRSARTPKKRLATLRASSARSRKFAVAVKQAGHGGSLSGQDGVAFKVDERGNAVPKGGPKQEIKNPYPAGATRNSSRPSRTG